MQRIQEVGSNINLTCPQRCGRCTLAKWDWFQQIRDSRHCKTPTLPETGQEYDLARYCIDALAENGDSNLLATWRVLVGAYEREAVA